MSSTRPPETLRSYIRIKPLLQGENQSSTISSYQNEVVVTKTGESFNFRQVFNEKSDNQQIFNVTVMPMIQLLLQGHNSCILAYGQTSSGKTYTMRGVKEHPGLIPLTIKQLFRCIEANQIMAHIKISYFQIYNENIIDLLSDVNPPNYLQVREDTKKNIIISELKEKKVQSEKDSLEFYQIGQQRRKFADNNINSNSSRSHAIFKISLQTVNENFEKCSAHISMVDLAGSESVGKVKGEGNLKKESQNINKSLLAMSNVIRSMSLNRFEFINFRDSKLTRILQPCLTTNANSIIICNIKQNQLSLPQTVNTLRFGVCAAEIRANPKRSVSNPNLDKNDNKILLQELQAERAKVKNLKQQNEELHETNKILDRYCEQYKKESQLTTMKLFVAENDCKAKDNLIENLKDQTQNDQKSKNVFFVNYEASKKGQQQEVQKYKAELQRKNQKIKAMETLIQQLDKNEKNLLEKLNKYERQLKSLDRCLQKAKKSKKDEPLRQSMQSQKSFNNTVTSRAKKQISIPSKYTTPQEQEKYQWHTWQTILKETSNRQAPDPLTIGTIVKLSAKILQLKRQNNQYVMFNSQLQEQNNQLINKANPELETQDQSPPKSKNYVQKTLSNEQAKRLKRKVKKYEIQLSAARKRQHKHLRILRKCSKNRIEEIQGFNYYLDNHGENQKDFHDLLHEDERWQPDHGNNGQPTNVDQPMDIQQQEEE